MKIDLDRVRLSIRSEPIGTGFLSTALATSPVDLNDATACMLYVLATCRELPKDMILDALDLAIFRAQDLRADMGCAE